MIQDPKIVCGIYTITNQHNGKVYVGQSVDIYRRWLDHRRALNRGLHINAHLQAAWCKYGEESFVFAIQQECLPEMLDAAESFWMDYYKSHDTTYGYNLLAGGQGRRIFTDAMVERLRQGHRNQFVPIMQVDNKGQVVKQYDSVSEAARTFKTTPTAILNCANYLHGLSASKRHRGFIWVRPQDYDLLVACWDDMYEKPRESTVAVNMYEYPSGTYLKHYASCLEAARDNGVSEDVVSLCVRGVQKHSGNKTFRRARDCHGEQKIDIEPPTKRSASKGRAVCAISENGDIIEVFVSIKEATLKYGDGTSKCCGHISECCKKKRKTAYGVRWAYLEEVETQS